MTKRPQGVRGINESTSHRKQDSKKIPGISMEASWTQAVGGWGGGREGVLGGTVSCRLTGSVQMAGLGASLLHHHNCQGDASPTQPPHYRQNTILNLLVFKLPGIHDQKGLLKLQTELILKQRHR